MKALLLLAALCGLPACTSAAPRIDKFAAPSRALTDAILAVASGSWDGGCGLDALLAGLKEGLGSSAMISIRAISAEGSRQDVRARVYARKWLAVKGYK